MLFSNHNESKAIAALLCPLLRARSPKIRFRCLAADDDEVFSTAFKTLQMMGGRKGLFQSRRNYVIDSILLSEFWFALSHPIIELHCTSVDEGFWTGAGEFKEISASEGLVLGGIFDAFGKQPPGPNALVQIDITRVWNDISPMLEDAATKLAAKREADDKLREMMLKARAQATGHSPPDEPYIL
jgi:hypothetical protein